MDLDLGGIVLQRPANDGVREPDNLNRILRVMSAMQSGITMLTETVAKHDARIEVLEGEARMLRARTELPKSSMLMVGDKKWPN